MAITDARLNLLTFPQRWDGAQLSLRVLALPKRDPRQPLFAGAAAFAQSTLRFRVRIIPSLDKMPDPAAALAAEPAFAESPPAVATVFDKLAESFNINPALVGNPHPANTAFKKYLTRSYQRAFAFDGPSRSFVFTNSAYECALKDPSLTNRPPRPAPTDELSWEQAIAFAIRQPVLASALGLLFERDVALPEPGTPSPPEAGFTWIWTMRAISQPSSGPSRSSWVSSPRVSRHSPRRGLCLRRSCSP
jgi:hypothetical protein